VRYDRKISARARTPDIFDYRAGYKQYLSDDGQASPSDRADPIKPWINWEVQTGDNPADLAAALDTSGTTLAQSCDI
jgi:hypothetical protein